MLPPDVVLVWRQEKCFVSRLVHDLVFYAPILQVSVVLLVVTVLNTEEGSQAIFSRIFVQFLSFFTLANTNVWHSIKAPCFVPFTILTAHDNASYENHSLTLICSSHGKNIVMSYANNLLTHFFLFSDQFIISLSSKNCINNVHYYPSHLSSSRSKHRKLLKCENLQLFFRFLSL